MADEEIERDELAHADREQSGDRPANEADRSEHRQIPRREPVPFRTAGVHCPGCGDQGRAEQDRERLVTEQNGMLIEAAQSLRQQHARHGQRKHPGDHQREIARADLRFEGLRLRLMQQPVGPAQRPHAHPEALDRHRHADHLQRRERHHVQFAQGVEDRHEHHASAGARRIGDDRACQADTGEKPQAPHQAARYRHQ